MTTFVCKKFHELTLKELYDVMVLRQAVFVVEQDCAYLDADGNDQKAWHLMGFDEQQQLVAYTRLLPKGTTYEKYPAFGRVVTSPAARGTGAGRALMEEALKWMKKLFPEDDVKISAQCYLDKFYKSFGFEIVGEEYLEDGIPHYPMLRKAND